MDETFKRKAHEYVQLMYKGRIFFPEARALLRDLTDRYGPSVVSKEINRLTGWNDPNYIPKAP